MLFIIGTILSPPPPVETQIRGDIPPFPTNTCLLFSREERHFLPSSARVELCRDPRC